MKVKELIEKLKEMDQEAVVLTDAYQNYYGIVNTVTTVKVVEFNDSEWYYASYRDFELGDNQDNAIEAVYID